MLKKLLFVIIAIVVIYIGAWFSIAAVAKINIRQLAQWEFKQMDLAEPEIVSSGFPFHFTFTIKGNTSQKEGASTSVKYQPMGDILVKMDPLMRHATITYPVEHVYSVNVPKLDAKQQESELYSIKHTGNTTAVITFKSSLWWRLFSHTDHASLINQFRHIHTELSNDQWEGDGFLIKTKDDDRQHTSDITWFDGSKEPRLTVKASFSPMLIKIPKELARHFVTDDSARVFMTLLLDQPSQIEVGGGTVFMDVSYDAKQTFFGVLNHMMFGALLVDKPTVNHYSLDVEGWPFIRKLNINLNGEQLVANATVAGNETVPENMKLLKNDKIFVEVGGLSSTIDLLHPMGNAHPYDSAIDFASHFNWLVGSFASEGVLTHFSLKPDGAITENQPGAIEYSSPYLTVTHSLPWAKILGPILTKIGIQHQCNEKDIEDWLDDYERSTKLKVWPECLNTVK
ncbi:MAG: hypothetical protein ACON5A_05185 [Candidatus Comchoanobacterales bacterium]